MKRAVMVAAAFCLLHCLAIAQSESKKQFAEAMKFYNSANFEKAITILAKMSGDNTIDHKEMKEILLALGRSYTAKGNKEKAMQAMTKLIDLEPPTITPDPDSECPPLMKIYGKCLFWMCLFSVE